VRADRGSQGIHQALRKKKMNCTAPKTRLGKQAAKLGPWAAHLAKTESSLGRVLDTNWGPVLRGRRRYS
jgi:hypothetical protein